MTEPSTLPPEYTQAFAALQAGELSQAENLALGLQNTYPDWAAVYNLLAAIALQQARPDRMEAALRRAVQLEPNASEPLHNLGKLLVSQQRQGEALLLWEQYIDQAQPDAELWLDLSKLYLQSGQLSQAEAWQQRLWGAVPETQQLPLALTLAQACQQAQAKALAQHWYEQALAQEPENLMAHNGLGWLHFEASRFAEAIAAWQKLTQAEPSVEHWNNLGSAYVQNHQQEAAREAWQAALALQPEHWQTRLNLAQLELSQLQAEAALEVLQPLFSSHSQLCVQVLASQAELWIQNNQDAKADLLLEACLNLPEDADHPHHHLLSHRANCAHILGQPHQPYLEAAQAQAPHKHYYAMEQLALALPYIYTSHSQLQSSRRQLKQSLERISERLRQDPRNADRRFAIRPLFLLAYQGENDLPIVEKLGKLWDELWPELGTRYEQQYPGPRRPGPLRVGFASAYFYNHSVLKAYQHRITQLAQDPDFEVVCFQLGEVANPAPSEFTQQVRLLTLQPPLPADILAHNLDVLIYTDIGMEAYSYNLAMQRLARVQCVLTGHPVTTGLPQIDYFLSGPAEAEGAQAHYSETLIQLPHIMPQIQPLKLELPAKAELGLSETHHNYFCPMTLFKVHPDFDELIAGILRTDPRGRVYFVRYQQSLWHQQLAARFASSIPDVAERIHFLPWMNAQLFQQTLAAADAVLDTRHFGGGTTWKAALKLGKAYITWPGTYVRSRFGARHYHGLGLHDCVANSAQDYVHKAVRLATEPEWRQDFEARLQERLLSKPESQAEALQALKDFLQRAAAAYPAKLPAESS